MRSCDTDGEDRKAGGTRGESELAVLCSLGATLRSSD